MKAEGERVGATLSWDESAGRFHSIFVKLSSDPASPVQAAAKFELSINLTYAVCFALVIPWDPFTLNLLIQTDPLSWLLHTSDLPQFTLKTSPKSLKCL